MSNEELALLVKNGDMDAAGQLWKQAYRFIKIKAYEYTDKNEYIDDMLQESFIEIVNACKAYQADESKFLTYYSNYYMYRAFYRAIYGRRKNDPIYNACSINDPLMGSGEISILDVLEDESSVNDFLRIIDDDYRDSVKKFLIEQAQRLRNRQGRELIIYMLQHNCSIKASIEAQENGKSYDSLYGSYKIALREFRYLLQGRSARLQMNLLALDDYSYRYAAGVGAFKNRLNTSSVEMAVIKREDDLKKLNRDKTTIDILI